MPIQEPQPTIEQPPAESRERELTPEEIGRFEVLMQPEQDRERIFVSSWDVQTNFENFLNLLRGSISIRGDVLRSRRSWIEMKQGGDRFKLFLQNKIRKMLDEANIYIPGRWDLYRDLHIYRSLGYADAVKFFGEVLTHKAIVKHHDGSYADFCLKSLEWLPGSGVEVREAILRHMEQIFSPDYARRDHRSYDLSQAATTLTTVLGTDTTTSETTLDEFFNEHSSYRDFWETNRSNILRGHDVTPYVFEPFNFQKETERLKELEEALQDTLILDLDFYRDRPGEGDPEEAQRFLQAKENVKSMGDSGVEKLRNAVLRGLLRVEVAVKLLDEINSDKAFEVLKEFWNSKDPMIKDPHGRVDFTLLDIFKNKNLVDTIPMIADRTWGYLTELRQTLEDNPSLATVEDVRFQTKITKIKLLLDSLSFFSDPKGYEEANRLFEEFRKLRSQTNELKIQERSRLSEFLPGPYEVNFEGFPVASEEERREILADIDVLTTGDPSWGNVFPRLQRRGKVAVPLLYQAIQEGRLARDQVLKRALIFEAEDAFPLYYYILLEHYAEGVPTLGDLVRFVTRYHGAEPVTVKVVAEFARRSAELILKTDDENLNLRHFLKSQTKAAFDCLGSFLSEEAKKLRRQLFRAYPEIVGRDVVAEVMGDVERPKTPEQRKWTHSKLFLKGPAVLAELLGKGKRKVGELDLVLTTSRYFDAPEEVKAAKLGNADDLELILPKEESQKVRRWIEEHGYQEKVINILRVPESNLEIMGMFQGEPRLLLWDTALEDEVEIYRYVAADLKKYKEGSYYHNPLSLGPEFSEVIVPWPTLAAALGLMHLAETFGLKYDETPLNQAEQAARASKLILSTISSELIERRQEGVPQETPVLDAEFLRIFRERKLRKTLLQKFPRLGQLTEAIVTSGGMEEYVRQNFGEVYLGRAVRLYDPNLTTSPASSEEQRAFLDLWYSVAQQADFNLAEAKKTTESPSLPKPANFESWVRKEELARVLETRRTRDSFLDRLGGRYKLVVENQEQPAVLKNKIDSFLRVMRLEWPAAIPMEKKKVTQTLIKLGMHPKNPVLAQFDSTTQHEVELVISPDPYDLLQASVEKPWHSCVCIMNSGECQGASHAHNQSPYEDIAGASVIVYVVKGDEFIARCFLRAGLTLREFKPAAALEKLYGDARYEAVMTETVKRILTDADIKFKTPMVTYPLKDCYTDSAQGQAGSSGNRLYYMGARY